MVHGLEFDISYAYSKSIDIGSNAERIHQFQGAGFASQVINSWAPGQLRAVSDFDNTHQFNTNWVWELPFGRGQHFGSGMGRLANSVVGGWMLSGLWRWTSGYPFSVSSGFGWATNFELQSQAVLTGPPPNSGTYILQGVTPNVFQNPVSGLNDFRPSFPGESGQRNELFGPGTFNIDMALAKSWNISETKAIKFTWETFNLTNTPKFDVGTMQLDGNNTLANNTSWQLRLHSFSVPRNGVRSAFLVLSANGFHRERRCRSPFSFLATDDNSILLCDSRAVRNLS
jgi:hypothetical protein